MEEEPQLLLEIFSVSSLPLGFQNRLYQENQDPPLKHPHTLQPALLIEGQQPHSFITCIVQILGLPDVNLTWGTAAVTRNQSGKCRCSSNIYKKCNIWITNSKHITKLKTCPLQNVSCTKSLGHLFSCFHCAKVYYQLLRSSLMPIVTTQNPVFIFYVYVYWESHLLPQL